MNINHLISRDIYKIFCRQWLQINKVTVVFIVVVGLTLAAFVFIILSLIGYEIWQRKQRTSPRYNAIKHFSNIKIALDIP